MATDTPGSTAGQDQQRGLADQLRDSASSTLSRQKDRATKSLGTIVEAVRDTGRQLGDRNQSGVARYVNKAADSLERWADTLQRKDIREIVEDVQRFGRRQPAMFIGLSIGAGLLGARFLKSSGRGVRASSYRDTPFGSADRDIYAARRAGTVARATNFGAPGGRTDLS
jgi:hypothetical protein